MDNNQYKKVIRALKKQRKEVSKSPKRAKEFLKQMGLWEFIKSKKTKNNSHVNKNAVILNEGRSQIIDC